MAGKEIIFQLALNLIDGIGFRIWSQLIQKLSSAEKVYLSTKEELHILLNNEKMVDAILNKTTVLQAENIFSRHLKAGVNIISYFDETYPVRLRHINDPPCFLFVKGRNVLAANRILSIIGTRYPSIYGKENVERFIYELKDYDVLIISGLAYGIDILAHKNALKYGLNTVGIIAGGIDRMYPQEHVNIAKEMIDKGGGIISESPLGTQPEKYLFPARNRVIAGCADAVLIVEAGHKSGTMITALCANDFDREVFAIPGDINKKTSVGCNNLIKNNQAQLVTTSEDIIIAMNWEKKEEKKQGDENEISGEEENISLNEEEEKIRNVLKGKEGLFIEQISNSLQLPIHETTMLLMKMEFKGLVTNIQGNKYKWNNIK